MRFAEAHLQIFDHMKRNFFVVLMCALLCACTTGNKVDSERPEIRFKDGKLRIAQFTDVHWDAEESSKGSDERIPQIIKSVVESQKPDVLVFTGDVVTGTPLVQGWRTFIDLMHEIGLPYAVMMGNHDPEAGVRYDSDGKTIYWETQQTRDSIFTYLEQSPLFLGERGPAQLQGMGNYSIPVLASDGSDKVKSVLYCMDSNDYSTDPRIDGYGWLTYEQIGWYRQQSRDYAAMNEGTPLPALAFFHIPLPEYHLIKGFEDTVGNRDEEVCSPYINTGMFAAMFEMQDIMAVFVGHDHNNDYIGQYHGIALAYGKATGVDTYGDMTKGGRIIDLYEEGRCFDTWIIDEHGTKADVYYYPSAISDNDLQTLEMLPSTDVKPEKKGVSYKYYEGMFKSTVLMAAEGRLVEQGQMQSLDITTAKVKDHFGYQFSCWLEVPETGIYKLLLGSDDGAVAIIDGNMIVDNDGSHSYREKSGKAYLEKGYHKLDVNYLDWTHGQKLNLTITGKRISALEDALYVR